MPGPLSNDLRERVVAARRSGLSRLEIAQQFFVSESSVRRWCRLDLKHGSVVSKPMGGIRPFALASKRDLFGSLYADRGSHYWITTEAGTIDRKNLTQVQRWLKQLAIELIPPYSPEGRGRSERMFGTLQGRLPQELRLAGITGMEATNRFLAETFLPAHNRRFQVAPDRVHPGRAHGRQGQYGALRAAYLADPGRQTPEPLRKVQGDGARIPGRLAGGIPRPPLPGPLQP